MKRQSIETDSAIAGQLDDRRSRPDQSRGYRPNAMATRALIVVAAVTAAALVAGCGSSGSSAAPPVKTPTAPVTVSSALAADLTARLKAADGTLVSPTGPARIQTAAEVRTDSGGHEHAADTLDAAGTEDLTTKIGNHGTRVVFHFPDAAKAMANYRTAARDAARSATTFTIPGIPNSTATDAAQASCGCRTVDFVIGEYEYRLGLSTDLGDSPNSAQFIAMIQAWYAKLTRMGRESDGSTR